VALKLLGGFALEVAGAQVPLRLSARRLVAFLGLRGESPRSAVAVSLRPNVDQERGKASLRTAMWRLHCQVPGLVQDEQEGIALAGPISIDIKDLEQVATTTSGSGRMPVGTETYAGDLLPGWYDEWVLCERERLRQVGLRALEAGASRLMEEGRWADALNVALEVIRLEPLRESAHRAVIAAHLAEDNFGEALRQYCLLSQLLEVDLGIRPSESTRALLSDRIPPRWAWTWPR